MAHTTIALTDEAWTLLTAANVTAVRIQNISGYPVLVQATVGATPPSNNAAGKAGAVKLLPGEGWDADVALSTRFPGVAGANRLYAWCDHSDAAGVSISHA